MTDLPELPAEPGVELVGPFEQRRLVVDGWQMPLIEAHEMDGGMICFVVDGRFGFDVPAGEFENVARLMAQVYAVAVGMTAWPAPDLPHAERHRWFQCVVHPALRPARLVGISAVRTEGTDATSDDPRDDA